MSIDLFEDELMTLMDVAKLLDVSVRTVRHWRDQGRLECVKVGGRSYTSRAAVQAFAEPTGRGVLGKAQPDSTAARRYLRRQYGLE